MSTDLGPGRRPSVCFVALNAYGLLSGRADLTHIGGAELQQVLLARELSSRGYRVSFVTLDHGQSDGIQHDGITVYRAYAPGAGLPGVRFFHPRWTGLWAAMARANADVYYNRCAGYEVGQVALWCRRHGRRFVFAVASDSDCIPQLPLLECHRERYLYRWGLRIAGTITAQTTTQQGLLRRNFGLESTVVPNCCPMPVEEEAPAADPGRNQSPRVLWLGRIAEQKRLEWLLDVAERCPQMVFDVVGASTAQSEYAARLTRRAAGIPNVVMHGRVPHDDVPRFYRRAAVLCCTSLYEGFPNTFLEAWSRGLPVVSTFDPDGVIAKHGIGWNTDTVDGVAEQLKRALTLPKEWRAASVAARRYCRENHSPEDSASRFEQVLRAVVSGNTPSAPAGPNGQA
jgi:glycosyltransferase involved in cell wall biosynthesis